MNEASILSRFDALVKSGVVLYDPSQETIRHVDGELELNFLLTSALIKKPTIQPQTAQSENLNGQKIDGSDISITGFEIGQVNSNTHFLIVRKFCYARPHLMLLTANGYRRQYEPLDESDLAATRYIAFYNCGRDGGCSRLHRHLQLIPKPPHSFADFLIAEDDAARPTNVPFQWFYQRLDVHTGQSTHADSTPSDAACPHNFIMGKRWMIVIPRRRAGIDKEAGANALGMLGAIAVATRPEMDNWVRLGLTESLRALCVPK
ncbi:hypothetical protein J3F83DRAFT_763651 [Trichoderma novae-zelandiae]